MLWIKRFSWNAMSCCILPTKGFWLLVERIIAMTHWKEFWVREEHLERAPAQCKELAQFLVFNWNLYMWVSKWHKWPSYLFGIHIAGYNSNGEDTWNCKEIFHNEQAIGVPVHWNEGKKLLTTDHITVTCTNRHILLGSDHYRSDPGAWQQDRVIIRVKQCSACNDS